MMTLTLPPWGFAVILGALVFAFALMASIIKAQIEANYLRRENDALCKENAEISLDAKEGRKIRRALEAHIEAAEKAEENKLLQYPYGKVCADDRHPG